tara:strand:- start:284 stop:610 length:327 start_codon:yes stop_codon:yes gene_type:complete
MSSKKEIINNLVNLNIPYKKWWSTEKLRLILLEYNLRTNCQQCGQKVSKTFIVIADPPFEEDDCGDYSGDGVSRQIYCERRYLCIVCAKNSGGWIQIEDVDDFISEQN